MNTTIAPARSLRAYRPGFLLGPLGWLGERLSASLAREPEFLAVLFALEPYAMHLLGIAMAHGCDESLLTPLFRQAPRALVEQSIGHWPEGLDRLLQVLPATVLSLEEYRAIPQLLSDKAHRKISAASANGRWADDRRPDRVTTRPAAGRRFSNCSTSLNAWTGSCMGCDS